MIITYNEVKPTDFETIKEIYKSCGWCAYLNDDNKLKNAFKNSLFLYGAYDEEKLVGFVRCVGDGEHVVVIQDLIVHSDYQKCKIGSYLFEFAMEKYKDVRMLLVITDLYDEIDNKFYQNKGLVKIEEKQMAAYTR